MSIRELVHNIDEQLPVASHVRILWTDGYVANLDRTGHLPFLTETFPEYVEMVVLTGTTPLVARSCTN